MNAGRASITIHDLARRLKVSSTTVWRALNDNPRISPKTRQRVMKAAQRYKYRPSLVAQTLSRGKTQTLGVIVPMIGNPVHAALVRAVEQVAFEREYSIILCDTDFRLDREKSYVDLLLRRRVEGMVIVPFVQRGADDCAHLASLESEGTAVVAMQLDLPGATLSRVVPDNRGAARALTEHLLDLGHRRIAFFHGGLAPWNVPMRERLEGYQQALSSAGIGFDPELVLQAGPFESVVSDAPATFWPDEVMRFMRRPERPTAIVAPVDVLAIKVMQVLSGMGLKIPDDVAVVGFDDILMSGYAAPPLTTVRQPSQQLGRRAADLLFQRLARKATGFGPRVCERIPCDLVIRQSCGATKDSATVGTEATNSTEKNH